MIEQNGRPVALADALEASHRGLIDRIIFSGPPAEPAIAIFTL